MLVDEVVFPDLAQAVAADGDEFLRRSQRPRALVLVPTRELAIQVLEVCKRIARTCKFSSCGVMGGEDYTKQKKVLAGTVDLVVASPGEYTEACVFQDEGRAVCVVFRERPRDPAPYTHAYIRCL